MVPKLYSTGQISENAFSVHLDLSENVSFIDFGAPNSDIVGDYSDVLWIASSETSNFWESEISGFKWNSYDPDAPVVM